MTVFTMGVVGLRDKVDALRETLDQVTRMTNEYPKEFEHDRVYDGKFNRAFWLTGGPGDGTLLEVRKVTLRGVLSDYHVRISHISHKTAWGEWMIVNENAFKALGMAINRVVK